jgi:hypothetical protein
VGSLTKNVGPFPAFFRTFSCFETGAYFWMFGCFVLLSLINDMGRCTSSHVIDSIASIRRVMNCV